MPQFDPSTYTTQLFWLVVTFLPLYLVLWKVVVPRITEVRDARQRKIDDDLEKAAELREEAESVLAALEKAHAEAAAKAQAIHRETAQAIAEEKARRQAELARRLTEEARAAEQRITEAKEKALRSVPDIAVEVTRAAVRKLVGAEIGEAEAAAAIRAAGRESGP